MASVSAGLFARAALALILAILISIRFLRSAKSSPILSAKVLRSVCLALGAFWLLTWLAIAIIRLRYPFELDWIGGAMRDHCLRVLNKQPLYVPPSSSWITYEYPPVYFWASAIVMTWMHNQTYTPMRLVSIASTIGTLLIMFAWCRSMILRRRDAGAPGAKTAAMAWSAISCGILLAAYRFTGAWYDAERLDMLFILLSMIGGYWLDRALNARQAPPLTKRAALLSPTAIEYVLLSSAAFVLAFFTKQQAALFVLGCAVALLVERRRGLLGLFLCSTVALSAMAIGALNSGTHDWFSYYCFRVPLTNGIHLSQAAQFVLLDLPLFGPAIALIVLCVRRAKSNAGASDDEHEVGPGRGDAVFVAMVISGVVGSGLSRAHWGGAENVLIAVYLLLAMAGCTAAGRFEISGGKGSSWLYLLAALQMAALTYRPDLQVPNKANFAAGRSYENLISSLEYEGQVLCLDHGGFTREAHFQIMGLLDVMGVEKGIPKQVEAALRLHRFAVIVTDAPPDTPGLMHDLLKYYPRVQKVGITGSWVVTGFTTPSPARPVYLLRP